VNEFLRHVRLPRAWGTEMKRLFSSSKTNPDHVPGLKAHTNHVFLGSGLLTVCADWPRPAGSASSSRIVKFCRHLQECHRVITRLPLQEAVRCRMLLCYRTWISSMLSLSFA